MPQASVPKPFRVLRTSPAAHRPRLWPRRVAEISLVPASLRALGDQRRACAGCGRSPLVGETVLVQGERIVCELCRPLQRSRSGHEEIVHSCEHEITVRRLHAA